MKFNYEDYKSKEAEEKQSTPTTSTLPNVQFVSNLLKKDGDTLVVRFPYHDTKDITIEHCHEVNIPGNPYPQKVECTKESGSCPLCDQKAKEVDRFLVKAIAYITNKETKTVDLIPVVWDRATAYADELESKMADYGDLTEHLFKIKRNGTGQSTTYSTDIILNKSVYDPAIYRNDLSLLENTFPERLLVRRMSKYLELTQPTPANEETQPSNTDDNKLNSSTFNYSTRTTNISNVEEDSSAPINPAFNRPKRVG